MIKKVFYIRRKENGIVAVSLDGLKRGEGNIDGFVYSLSSSVSREEEASLRNSVLSDIDRELSLYIQERSYIKRLLVSALVFLSVYFFCSFVIRDPIPMADELIAASISAVFAWLLLRRKDYRRALVSEDRKRYEKALFDADFSYESEIRYAEEYMDGLSTYDLKTLSLLIADDEVPELDFELSEELEDAIIWHVKNDDKLIYRYAREIKEHAKNPASIQKSIIKDTSTGLLDPIFLAFYLRIGRNQN